MSGRYSQRHMYSVANINSGKPCKWQTCRLKVHDCTTGSCWEWKNYEVEIYEYVFNDILIVLYLSFADRKPPLRTKEIQQQAPEQARNLTFF